MDEARLILTGSTMDDARRLLARGAKAPFLVRADRQTAGRGQRGRAWASPIGGAWTTTTAWVGPEPLPAWAMLGVAWEVLGVVQRALTRSGAAAQACALRLKWPNDVTADGAHPALRGRLGGGLWKIAGILGERDGEHVHVGVGVNANLGPADLPAGTRLPAASLGMLGAGRVPIDQLCRQIARAVVAALAPAHAAQPPAPGAMPPALLASINQRLAWRGQGVSLAPPDADHGAAAGLTRGVLAGIDEHGRALIAEHNAPLRAWSGGELSLAGPTP